jgi:hypothetical protein
MKRNLTLLTILGALIALAVPASSMASMYPAGHKFEIAGNAYGPKLTTSLGSCPITKITGTIPAAPKNEELGSFPASVTAGTCTTGTTITLASEWNVSPTGYSVFLVRIASEPIVMRFSSLPGCKLAGGTALGGIWSNGTTAPTLLKSGFHAHGGTPLTWANDGGSCALAGKTEEVSWESATGVAGQSQMVTDLTSPTTPIIVGNNK